jgi:hypothetical protein
MLPFQPYSMSLLSLLKKKKKSKFVGEVSANFADRVCHVVSVTDPYDRILEVLDRSSYFSFEVAP